MKLRHDDPVAMKNFILCVQNRMNALKATSEDGKANIKSKRVCSLHSSFRNFSANLSLFAIVYLVILADGVYARNHMRYQEQQKKP